MTHLENIPHILEYGITHISSPNNNPNYIAIGDGSLITNRSHYMLPNGIRLGTYIPFYFGVRMPMLFVIQQGFNGVKVTSADNIVYCVTSVSEIVNHNLEFIFSNGHAVDDLTEFYDMDRISEIKRLVDMKAAMAKYWKDEHDLDLKRRKEAEFLIRNDLPINAIRGYIVYNKTAKEKLIAFGIEEKLIVIKPNYYF